MIFGGFDPDDDTLGPSDYARLEYALKLRMAARFGAHQSKRANNLDGLNVGSARSYVQEARTLRRLLNKRGRQSYKPLRSIHGGDGWINTERAERAGISSNDDLIDVVRALHDDGAIAVDRRPTATTHTTVPGHTNADD